MTITNANFDDRSLIQVIKDCISYRDNLKSKVRIPENHPSISWTGQSDEELLEKAKATGTLTYDSNEDMRIFNLA